MKETKKIVKFKQYIQKGGVLAHYIKHKYPYFDLVYDKLILNKSRQLIVYKYGLNPGNYYCCINSTRQKMAYGELNKFDLILSYFNYIYELKKIKDFTVDEEIFYNYFLSNLFKGDDVLMKIFVQKFFYKNYTAQQIAQNTYYSVHTVFNKINEIKCYAEKMNIEIIKDLYKRSRLSSAKNI